MYRSEVLVSLKRPCMRRRLQIPQKHKRVSVLVRLVSKDVSWCLTPADILICPILAMQPITWQSHVGERTAYYTFKRWKCRCFMFVSILKSFATSVSWNSHTKRGWSTSWLQLSCRESLTTEKRFHLWVAESDYKFRRRVRRCPRT